MDTPGAVTVPPASGNVDATNMDVGTAHLGGPSVMDAVESAKIVDVDDPNEWTSPKGFIFAITKIPKLVIVEAGKRISMPQPPNVFIEGKDRFEPNSNDPHYIDSMSDYKYRQGMVSVNVSLALGTKVKHVPTGYVDHTSKEWSDLLEGFDLVIPEDGRNRYVAWLKYYVLDDDELNDLARKIMRLSGFVFEQEVASTIVNFPGNKARNPDSGNGTS